jgi:regulator of nucleoside diphosphate kinase
MRPTIVISSLDMERLEALVETLPAFQARAQEALLAELARAEIVDPQEMPADVVTMNSRVRFVLDDAEEREMVLVYPKDMDGSPDKLSILTPIGNALLGVRAGDGITWARPDGTPCIVTVRDIVYQPERAGALHR